MRQRQSITSFAKESELSKTINVFHYESPQKKQNLYVRAISFWFLILRDAISLVFRMKSLCHHFLLTS